MNNNLALPKGKKNQVCVLVDEQQQRYKFVDLDDVLLADGRTLKEHFENQKNQMILMQEAIDKQQEEIKTLKAFLTNIGMLTVKVAEEGANSDL